MCVFVLCVFVLCVLVLCVFVFCVFVLCELGTEGVREREGGREGEREINF